MKNHHHILLVVYDWMWIQYKAIQSIVSHNNKRKERFYLKKKKNRERNRTQSCESGDEVRDSKCKFGLFCFVAPLVKFCDQLGQNNPDNYQKLKNSFSKKEVI